MLYLILAKQPFSIRSCAISLGTFRREILYEPGILLEAHITNRVLYMYVLLIVYWLVLYLITPFHFF